VCRTVLFFQVFSKRINDVTEVCIANKFILLHFYDVALCNLGLMICGSYTE